MAWQTFMAGTAPGDPDRQVAVMPSRWMGQATWSVGERPSFGAILMFQRHGVKVMAGRAW